MKGNNTNGPMRRPQISVVVPVYNGARTLAETLRALSRQDYPRREVIVVDDGSDDDSAELALGRGAHRVVRLSRNWGAGTARNVGARLARGEVLAFTDADCVPPARWLSTAVSELAARPVAGVSGPYHGPWPVGGAHRPGFAARFAHLLLQAKEQPRSTETCSCTTSNLVCWRDAFWRTGGFPIFALGHRPERPYQGHEDANWGFRTARALGRGILWQRRLTVAHQFRETLLDFLREQRFYGEVILVSHIKYPAMLLNTRSNFNKLSTLLQVAPIAGALLGGGALAGGAALCGNPLPLLGLGALTLAGVPLAVLAGNIPLLRLAWREERSLAFLAASAGALVLTHGAWILGALQGLARVTRAGFRLPDLHPEPDFEELSPAAARTTG